MPRRLIVSFGLVALLLGACGRGGSTAAPEPGTTSVQQLSSPYWEKAGPSPSTSAKMICQEEARKDIAASLGVTEARVTAPRWIEREHLYACTYVYPRGGKLRLSVKELSSERETTDYFDFVVKKYGPTQRLVGIGQGSWILGNNDVVVRKDYKVLRVDVSGLPRAVGALVPTMSRSDVATNVAVAILGCWTGA